MADEAKTDAARTVEAPKTEAVAGQEAVAFVKEHIAANAEPAQAVVEKPVAKIVPPITDTAAPETPAMPVDLIARATAAGFTLEDVAEFGGEKALRKAVEMIEKRPVVAKEQEKVAEPAKPAEDELAFPDPATLDPKDWDKETFQMLKAGHAMAKRLADLEKKLADTQPVIEQQRSTQAQAQVQELTTQIDTAFAGLGEDFHGIVGKGTIHEIKQGSPELKARNDILAKAEILAKGYNASGRQMPVQDLIREAATLVFSGEVAKRRVNDADRLKRERQGQFISRPGQTGKPQEPTGQNAAVDFVRQSLAAAQT